MAKNSPTMKAIEYSISFDDKEAKASSNKLYTILQKMEKLVMDIGKKAIEVKNKVMAAMKMMVDSVVGAFETIRKKFLDRFMHPGLFLLDRFKKSLGMISKVYDAIFKTMTNTEGVWFRVRQNVLNYFRVLIGIGAEKKRHLKMYEEEEKRVKGITERMKDYYSKAKEFAIGSAVVGGMVKVAREEDALKGLRNKGWSNQTIGDLPNNIRNMANEALPGRPVDSNDAAQILYSGAKRDQYGEFERDKQLEFMRRALTYQKITGETAETSAEAIVTMNRELKLSGDQYDALIGRVQFFAAKTATAYDEMSPLLQQSMETANELKIAQENQLNFVTQLTGVSAQLKNMGMSKDDIDMFLKNYRAGWANDSDQIKKISGFLGIDANVMKQELEKGNIAKVMDNLFTKIKEGAPDDVVLFNTIFGEDFAKITSQIKKNKLKFGDLMLGANKVDKPFSQELNSIQKLTYMAQTFGRVVTAVFTPLKKFFFDPIIDFFYKGAILLQKFVTKFNDFSDKGKLLGSLGIMVVVTGKLGAAFSLLGRIGLQVLKLFLWPLKLVVGSLTSRIGLVMLFQKVSAFVSGGYFSMLGAQFAKFGSAAGRAGTPLGFFARMLGDVGKFLGGEKGIFKSVFGFLTREFPKVTAAIGRFITKASLFVTIIWEVIAVLNKWRQAGGWSDLVKGLTMEGGAGESVENLTSSFRKLNKAVAENWVTTLATMGLSRVFANQADERFNKIVTDPRWAGLKQTINSIWSGYLTGMKGIWEDSKAYLSTQWEALKTMASMATAWIEAKINATIERVKNIAKGILGPIYDPIAEQVKNIGAAFDWIVEKIKIAGNFWKEAFTFENDDLGILGKILDWDIFKGAKNVGDAKRILGDDLFAKLSGGKVSGKPAGAPTTLPAGVPPASTGGKFDDYILAASEKYNVDPNLIRSVIQQESKFDPNAGSNKGAGGLMQLMPDTAKDLGLTPAERFDPEKNIDAGTKYLSQQLDRYHGDISLALAAYNAGPGNVNKYGGVPPFAETQNYVSKITADYENRTAASQGQDGMAIASLAPTGQQVSVEVNQSEVVGELSQIRTLLARYLSNGDQGRGISGGAEVSPMAGTMDQIAASAL